MLTARGTEADRVVGLDTGADDYVVAVSPRELVSRIRAVFRRGLRSTAARPSNMARWRWIRSPRGAGERCPVRLGLAEFKLLNFFVSHPDGVSRATPRQRLG
jgi:DNA-binding response OmpR family regulator